MSEFQKTTQGFNKATLRSISFDSLKQHESGSIAALLAAACESGFFYLDLTDVGNEGFLADAEELFSVASQVFDLDELEKMRYDLDVIGPHKISGYKPTGRNTGVSAKKQDGFEIYLISKNEIEAIDENGRVNHARPLMEPSVPVGRFARRAHDIGLCLMQCLSEDLGLETRFETSHRHGEPSTSAVGLLKYPPASALAGDRLGQHRLGQIAHTDVGSITLLFTQLDGLQVFNPSPTTRSDTDDWGWIPPLAGHAVVNIGDSLRFMSGGKLNSSLHRVIPHHSTTSQARYSIAYFMRPEYQAEFRDDQGTGWTGLGWHTRKFKVFRAPIAEQSQSAVLTGKDGYLGLWNHVEEQQCCALI